jgi:hypothetical protein
VRARAHLEDVKERKISFLNMLVTIPTEIFWLHSYVFPHHISACISFPPTPKTDPQPVKI